MSNKIISIQIKMSVFILLIYRMKINEECFLKQFLSTEQQPNVYKMLLEEHYFLPMFFFFLESKANILSLGLTISTGILSVCLLTLEHTS